MINFLLKNGANVNATTFSGNTPLHVASGLGMDQLVHLLIRNGANINIRNLEGDTPLYTKVCWTFTNIVLRDNMNFGYCVLSIQA